MLELLQPDSGHRLHVSAAKGLNPTCSSSSGVRCRAAAAGESGPLGCPSAPGSSSCCSGCAPALAAGPAAPSAPAALPGPGAAALPGRCGPDRCAKPRQADCQTASALSGGSPDAAGLSSCGSCSSFVPDVEVDCSLLGRLPRARIIAAVRAEAAAAAAAAAGSSPSASAGRTAVRDVLLRLAFT